MDKKFCEYDKETETMYRWKTMVGNAPLQIYLPKWRVPDPYPSHISVEIFERAEYPQSIYPIEQKEAIANPQLLHNPITAEVTYLEDHTLTAKYDPVLDKGKREIGNPYIPYTLLSDPPPTRLVIVVNWEK